MPTPQALPASPTLSALAGPPPPQMSADGNTTSGAAQVGSSLVKMGVEISQSLNILAKASPLMAPWVLKTTLELQQQIGKALQQSADLTSLGSPGDSAFPDGSSRLSGLAG